MGSGLLKLAENFWIKESSFKAMGVSTSLRMSIIKNSDGSLLLVSPVKLNESEVSEIKELGPVKHIIAPNKFHHLFANRAKAFFPGATLYAAPGLKEKIKTLKVDEVIDPGQRYPWSEELEHLVVQGMPGLNEVIFFHRPTRTLILTDLSFNVCHAENLWSQMFWRLWGVWKKLGPSFLIVKVFTKDRKAVRDSLSKMTEWDFQRIVLAHGDVIHENGKSDLVSRFQQLEMIHHQ